MNYFISMHEIAVFPWIASLFTMFPLVGGEIISIKTSEHISDPLSPRINQIYLFNSRQAQ